MIVLLGFFAALSSSTPSVVDVPAGCRRVRDGLRCGDVDLDVEARYGLAPDDAHQDFQQATRALARTGRGYSTSLSTLTEHEHGVTLTVDAAAVSRHKRLTSYRVFAAHAREDGVTVGVTCETSRAKDADAAWARCQKAVTGVLFGGGRLPSSPAARVAAIVDMEPRHRGRVRCRGSAREGSCAALAVSWTSGDADAAVARAKKGVGAAGVETSETCTALGWTSQCTVLEAGKDKGAIVAKTPAGLVVTCAELGRCGALFIRAPAEAAPAAATASAADKPAAADTTASAAPPPATPPDEGDASSTAPGDHPRSLVDWDKAYESDPQKAATGYARAAWRAAEKARATDRRTALGLARVVEHLDPSHARAKALDKEITGDHMVQSMTELVGGTVAAAAGVAGGMALFSSKDPTVEGLGVILGVVVVPPAVAFAIIGGVGTYDETTTKDITPTLPEGLEHRAAWIAGADGTAPTGAGSTAAAPAP